MTGADAIVVGAGLFGLTVAERIANELGRRVLVLDRRAHIGGGCYSEPDAATGIEVHRYGSHIFHCSDEEVWRYVNRFGGFNGYRHHVHTVHRGQVYPMPVNLATLSALYGRMLSPDEARALIGAEAAAAGAPAPRNLEEKAISLVGRRVYETLIRGYTLKQWDTDPRRLPPEIISRLPVRYTFDGRYFDDRHEGIPRDGYGALTRRMAASERIEIRLDADFFTLRDRLPGDALVIYTGPVDRYFEFRCGPLGWRAVRFEREIVGTRDFQGTAVVNYADAEVPWTRIHEFRHYHPERTYPADRTVIFREFACPPGADADPAYPVRTAEDRHRFEAYRELARAETGVVFGGRLGTYRYLDMHQAIGAALRCFENVIRGHFAGRAIDGAMALP